jgi:hypothetical protein
MPAAKTTTKKTAKTAAGKSGSKTAKKVTLDDVWAIIAEIGEAHKETERGMRELQEAHKETEKAIKEVQEAHKKTEKTLNKAIGGLGNTLGSLVEHVMTPDLPRKFKQFGFTFNRITIVKYAYGKGNIYAEIDGLLEDGSQAVVVEVKTRLRPEDIDDHLGRMERVRKYADDHGDKREFFGAMAATITDENTRKYALSKGFFVIEPSGEDVKITKPAFEPKIW